MIRSFLLAAMGTTLVACAHQPIQTTQQMQRVNEPTVRSQERERLLNEALASASTLRIATVMTEHDAVQNETAVEASYFPVLGNGAYLAKGVASWYGGRFHGRKTASGEIFDMNALTAAHPTLPLGSWVRVTNTLNHKSVILKVNDRGPYHKGRLIDVSKAAAKVLDFKTRGNAPVTIERVVKRAPTEHERRYLAQEDVKNTPIYLSLGSFDEAARAKNVLTRTQMMLNKQTISQRLEIVNDEGRYLVRVGPFLAASRARDLANRLNVQMVLMQ